MSEVSPEVLALVRLADDVVGQWFGVRHHSWTSLYAWQNAPLYNAFGEVVGEMEADTIYIQDNSPCPDQDLFHELGHAIARRFDLIGHRQNGFLGAWEQRHARTVGAVRHQRHWSRLLDRVRRGAPPYTPDLCSEIWAELFMSWFLFPERRETTLIAVEMNRIAHYPEMQSIERLANRVVTPATTAPRRL